MVNSRNDARSVQVTLPEEMRGAVEAIRVRNRLSTSATMRMLVAEALAARELLAVKDAYVMPLPASQHKGAAL